MSVLGVRTKVWLVLEDEIFLGEGRARLLREVAASGSISAAARALDIPYRKAWALLDTMEQRAPWPLLERHKGGAQGGVTRLTPQGQWLLAEYDRLHQAALAATATVQAPPEGRDAEL